MKKNDIILLCVLLCIGGLFVAWNQWKQEPGNQVVITVDGEVYDVLELDEDQEVTIECDDGHYNIVQIKDGVVDMTEADCGNQVCVDSATISEVGENIVCLPHKVVVKIVSGEKE